MVNNVRRDKSLLVLYFSNLSVNGEKVNNEADKNGEANGKHYVDFSIAPHYTFRGIRILGNCG